jgi:hypothetical protein
LLLVQLVFVTSVVLFSFQVVFPMVSTVVLPQYRGTAFSLLVADAAAHAA